MLPRVLLANRVPAGGSGVAGLVLPADLGLAGAFLLGIERLITLTFSPNKEDSHQRARTILTSLRPIQKWLTDSVF